MTKDKKAIYGYTIRDDADPKSKDQSGDKFDEEALRRNEAMLVTTDKPDRKAMRYMGARDPDAAYDPDYSPNLNATKAGAGRGVTRPVKGKDYAKGGRTASKRADGIAQRGKTRGRLI